MTGNFRGIILWIIYVCFVVLMFIRNKEIIIEMNNMPQYKEARIMPLKIFLSPIKSSKKIVVLYQLVMLPFSVLSLLAIANSIFAFINDSIHVVDSWIGFSASTFVIGGVVIIGWFPIYFIFQIINLINRKYRN